MARIPCSFSAQEDFVLDIDRRAAELGMKRSEYIVHALRMELTRGGAMVIQAKQSGRGNKQQIFSAAPGAPAPGQEKGRKGKRGKTENNK